MSVDRLAETIGRVLDRIAAARSALAHASQTTVEARDMYAQCFEGIHDPDAGQAPGAAAEAAEQVDQQHGRLAQIEQTLRGYLDQLGASLPGSAPTSAPTPKPGAAPPPASAPKATPSERARAALPPPVKPGTGDKTRGFWWTADGDDMTEIVSGRDENADRVDEWVAAQRFPMAPIARAGDVELKLAAHMVRNDIREASVAINNVPCIGPASCDTLAPVMLPKGSRLTVHGTKPDGTPTTTTYEGGRAPWWR
ncbi:hypothetical protein GCM10009676_44950 [Prauserella halophila]|uniref:SCP1.201-like deaminase n=1 Tax=Prauserella halophila TaxID=185641 RepID=A0ABP4HB19_9PSEU|nr:DddA-like double-stranded DNA deaminase toxin [Prauserella halophila]MCP2237645.1 SCP1.201-like deaminase [Prauserella halophila]